MGRKPEMWYRKERKAWFVTINGQRHNLGGDKKKATTQFHKLMGEEAPKLVLKGNAAAAILDKFLLWVEANKAPRTYDWYQCHIQSFLDSLPDQTIDAEALKPHHVTDWVKPTWSKSYTRGAMIAVQRAMKWAVSQGYIGKSPLVSLEKPAAERRDNCPTQAEVDEMLKESRSFKPVLEFMLETGCRPHEVRIMEASHVKGDRIEFTVNESKGKKRKRIIYLTEKAKAIVQKNCVIAQELRTPQNPYVFTNRNGNPWTAYAIDCAMKRIAKRTGKKWAAVDLRHYTCTRWLEAGVDHMTVAAWLGHNSAAMVIKHYGHIGQNSNRLLEKLRSVQ
jgi:site-specific recombinase XerD